SVYHPKCQDDHTDGHTKSSHQPLRGAENVTALPGHERTKWHHKQERNKERPEGQIEKWRTNGNFVTGQSLERQWVERANENGETGCRKEEIIEDESGLS